MTKLELFQVVVTEGRRLVVPAPGWVSDGYVAVFVGEGNEPEEYERLSPRSAVVLSESLSARRTPLIEDKAHRQPFVRGVDPVTKMCAECRGEGSEECNLGHEHDCKACDGAGEIEVKPGKMEERGLVVFIPGPIHFQARYAPIFDLPGAQVWATGTELDAAVVTVGDDVVGIVMPMRVP